MEETDPYDITITIHWYCGCYVDKGGYQHFDWEELPECGEEFDTEDTFGEWQTKNCTAVCPSCHAELNQTYDAQSMTQTPLSI
jgi:hypothetical protein